MEAGGQEHCFLLAMAYTKTIQTSRLHCNQHSQLAHIPSYNTTKGKL